MVNGSETVDHTAREGIAKLGERIEHITARHDEFMDRFAKHLEHEERVQRSVDEKLDTLTSRSLKRDAREAERIKNYERARQDSERQKNRRAWLISTAIAAAGLAMAMMEAYLK